MDYSYFSRNYTWKKKREGEEFHICTLSKPVFRHKTTLCYTFKS